MFSTLLSVVYAVLVGLVIFNLTIFVHEMGHFLVGKWRGAKIDRFAIWFGPAIWKTTIKGVEFRLGCVPLGGYVAFPQLAMEAIEGKSDTPIEEIPPLKPVDKIPILVAGSVANVLLGLVVACIVWVVGIPKPQSMFDMTVGYLPADSVEYQAGIRSGDTIVSINDKKVEDREELRYAVALCLTREIHVGLIRNGQPVEATVLPGKDSDFGIRTLNLDAKNIPVAVKVEPGTPAAEAGVQDNDELLELNGIPLLGFTHLVEILKDRVNQPTDLKVSREGKMVDLTVTPLLEKNSKTPKIGARIGQKPIEEGMRVKYPTPWIQIKSSVFMILDTIRAIVHRNTTGVGVGDLAGPVGIMETLYQRVQIDLRLAIYFMVILNINLAIMNMLPIPVLDGGHIVFSILEWIRGKPVVNLVWMERINTVFVVLLLCFMAFVTLNDVKRSMKFGAISQVKDSIIPKEEEKEASMEFIRDASNSNQQGEKDREQATTVGVPAESNAPPANP